MDHLTTCLEFVNRPHKLNMVPTIVAHLTERAESTCKRFGDIAEGIKRQFKIDGDIDNFDDVIRYCDEVLKNTYLLKDYGIEQITLDDYEERKRINAGARGRSLTPRSQGGRNETRRPS